MQTMSSLRPKTEARVRSPVMDDNEFERTHAMHKADEMQIRIQTELMKLKYTPRDKIRTKFIVPEKIVEKPMFTRQEILERIKAEQKLKSKMREEVNSLTGSFRNLLKEVQTFTPEKSLETIQLLKLYENERLDKINEELDRLTKSNKNSSSKFANINSRFREPKQFHLEQKETTTPKLELSLTKKKNEAVRAKVYDYLHSPRFGLSRREEIENAKKAETSKDIARKSNPSSPFKTSA